MNSPTLGEFTTAETHKNYFDWLSPTDIFYISLCFPSAINLEF